MEQSFDRNFPPPRVLTSADVARMFDIGVCTARRWLREGRIPGAQIGRRWYASREAVVELVEQLADESTHSPVLRLDRGDEP